MDTLSGGGRGGGGNSVKFDPFLNGVYTKSKDISPIVPLQNIPPFRTVCR